MPAMTSAAGAGRLRAAAEFTLTSQNTARAIAGLGRSIRGDYTVRHEVQSRRGGSMTRALIDSFGRRISYVRLSITDRCDLRCRYCMAEKMTFLPRSQLLTIEELEELSAIFIDLGVRRIRLTGGEPLVRRNIIELVRYLGRQVGE